MAVIVGELAAILRAEGTQQFGRDLQNAGKQLENAGNRGGKAGAAIAATFKAASVTATALTGAALGVAVGVFKTGLAYNQLQQQSRAALTTLMGGAEKANAQMDKLDAFARNSPFAKDVFIRAQQQMISFGVESEKVIPTLDAVQNAVAAMGGSSADVEGLIFVMNQIRAAGKITGQDLMQFGNRGIDAASMIGQAMGKTGQQIRTEITNGTLDANKAMDALTSSMASNFAGAAAGVKATMSGAVDRVRAATREIGAALAEPFISQRGGGYAVTWVNQLADILRAVETRIRPIIGQVTTALGPAFQKVSDVLVRIKQGIGSINIPTNWSATFSKWSVYAPGIAALASALYAMGTQSLPFIGKFLPTINPLVAAFAGLAAASPQLRGALGDMARALSPLLPMFADLSKTLGQVLAGFLPSVAGLITGVAKAISPLVQMLAAIPTPVLAGVAAFIAMKSIFGTMSGPIKAANEAVTLVIASFKNVGFGQTVKDVTGLVTGFSSASGAVKGLGTAMKTAFLSNPIGIALTVISAAVGLWMAANARAQAAVQAHKEAVANLRESLNEANGSFTDATAKAITQADAYKNVQDTLGKVGISQQVYADAVMGNKGSQAVLNEELVKYARNLIDSKGRMNEFNAAAQSVGMTTDQYIQALVDGTVNANQYSAAVTQTGNATQGTLRDTIKLIQPVTDVSKAYKDQAKQLQEAVDQQSRAAQLNRDIAASADAATQSNGRLNDAIKTARDTSKDASERLSALKRALDELKGGTVSAAQQQRDMARSSLDLADALNATDENGKKASKTMIDASGTINNTTRSGLNLSDQIGQMNDNMLDAIQSTYDLSKSQGDDLTTSTQKATDAGKKYIDNLRTTLKEAGLTQGQIDGLISKYMDVPATVATLVTDNGSIDEVQGGILGVITQLGQLPKGKSLTIDAPTDDVIKGLENVGVNVKKLPNGKVTVTGDVAKALAGFQDVQTALQNITDKKAIKIEADNTKVLDALKKVGIATMTLPDGSVAVDTKAVTDAKKKLEELGIKVAEKKDGKVTVSVLGDKEAAAKVDAVANKKRDAKISTSETGSAAADKALNNAARNRNSTITANAATGAAAEALARLTVPRSVQLNVIANSNGARTMVADGGMFTRGVRSYASGGFESGIYKAQNPGIVKFAEPETGWEAYISGKPAKRERNVRILSMTAQKLGVEVIDPRKTRGFANGEFDYRRPDALQAPGGANVSLQIVNPVVRDLVQDTREAAQVARGTLGVLH